MDETQANISPDVFTFIGNTPPTLEDDPFGFDGVARRLADAVVRQAGKSGFVIGIEGEWGAGKSVMMARLRHHLDDGQSFVVDFRPWLVSNREALIEELFAALAKALADASYDRGDATDRTTLAFRSALAHVRRYEKGLVAAGHAIEASSILTGPWGSLIGKSVGKFGKSLGEGRKKPLSELKKETCKSLKDLHRPIVVLIDDVDRLEPQAAVELMRLLQAVADFPNVIYVLCYDRRRLAGGLQQFLKVDDGDAYLEKIIQLPVTVPLVQSSDLEQRFVERLTQLVGEKAMTGGALGDVLRRHIGRSLTTPRSVNRVLDLIGFVWPGLEGKVDLADLVWLQLIRAVDGGLYRWIEEYSLMVTSNASDSMRNTAHAATLVATLQEIIGDGRGVVTWDDLRQRLAFVDLEAKDIGDALFAEAAPARTLAMGRSGSLASPEHARLYFGLVPTPGAEINGALKEIAAACRGSEGLGPLLLRLAKETARSGTPRLVVAIDHLANGEVANLSDGDRQALLKGVLSETDALLAQIPTKRRASLNAALLALLEAIAETFDEQRWLELLNHALGDAQADVFFTDRLTDRRVQAPRLAGAEARGILVQYLRERYAAVDLDRFVCRHDLLQALSIWEEADPASFRILLQRIYDDDLSLPAALAKYVTAYTKHMPLGPDTGRMVLQTILDNLWGLDNIARRLPFPEDNVHERHRSALADLGSLMTNDWERNLGNSSGLGPAENMSN